MIIRTTKVLATTNEEIYSSTCTIDGNTITGTQDPFPYIFRKLRKMGLRIYKMDEDGFNVTLYAR